MSQGSDKPLMTFAVAAFNQERFIREAVEAALAQTYSPLEIVLSDDNSRDRTFEIMQEMAAAYRGPHRVILNRNPVQRSIGGHFNRVMEISHGELMVGAAGDDISLPERVEVMREAWEASGRKATSIHAGIIQIDETGKTIERVLAAHESAVVSGGPIEQSVRPLAYVRTLEPLIYGCAHAISRRLFQVFGNLPEEVIHEDNALGFRSVLAGQIVFVNRPLVKYRVHGANVFIHRRQSRENLQALERDENRTRRAFKNRETMYRTFLLDLQTARNQNLIGEEEFRAAAAESSRLAARVALMGKYLQSGFFQRWRILSTLRRQGLNGKEYKVLARRLVPLPLLLRMRLAWSYAAAARNR